MPFSCLMLDMTYPYVKKVIKKNDDNFCQIIYSYYEIKRQRGKGKETEMNDITVSILFNKVLRIMKEK